MSEKELLIAATEIGNYPTDFTKYKSIYIMLSTPNTYDSVKTFSVEELKATGAHYDSVNNAHYVDGYEKGVTFMISLTGIQILQMYKGTKISSQTLNVNVFGLK